PSPPCRGFAIAPLAAAPPDPAAPLVPFRPRGVAPAISVRGDRVGRAARAIAAARWSVVAAVRAIVRELAPTQPARPRPGSAPRTSRRGGTATPTRRRAVHPLRAARRRRAQSRRAQGEAPPPGGRG